MKDNSVNALILNITEVVLRTHFYYVNSKDLQQDLMQEGYLKAYELLSSGNYDPYRNLRTYIYTGVRNAMTNYMYHQNKENHTSTDVIFEASWQDYKNVVNDKYYESKVYYYDDIETDIYKLHIQDILTITTKYLDFGDFTDEAEKYFTKLGIYKNKNKSSSNNLENINDSLVFEAIKGEILWNLFNKK